MPKRQNSEAKNPCIFVYSKALSKEIKRGYRCSQEGFIDSDGKMRCCIHRLESMMLEDIETKKDIVCESMEELCCSIIRIQRDQLEKELEALMEREKGISEKRKTVRKELSVMSQKLKDLNEMFAIKRKKDENAIEKYEEEKSDEEKNDENAPGGKLVETKKEDAAQVAPEKKEAAGFFKQVANAVTFQ